MNIVMKPLLFLLSQRDSVAVSVLALGKAQIQVCLRRGQRLEVIRVDGQHDALVHLGVNLVEMMALILIDKEHIPGLNIVKTVVDQKLLSSRDGVVNLITVVDMHGHRLFVTVQVGYGKILLSDTVVNRLMTGI